VKPTFWFPSLFLLGYVMGVFHYFVWGYGHLLALYGLYTFIVFFHALIVTKNVNIAAMAIIATYVQMFSYGYGFLKSWIKLNILRQSPKEAFPSHFH